MTPERDVPYVKARIASLSKDVRINRFTDAEALASGVMTSVVNVDLCEDPDAEDAPDANYTVRIADDFENVVAYSKLIDVIQCCCPRHNALFKELLELEPKVSSAALIELYRACILVNPAIDRTTHDIICPDEPYDEELERAVAMMPRLGPLVLSNLFRYEQLSPQDVFYEIMDALEDAADTPDYVRAAEAPAGSLPIDPEPEPVDTELLDRVRTLKEELSKRVIGQELAIEHVYAMARRAAAGFRDTRRPLGVLVFAGPTGVGKTELAKAIASTMYEAGDSPEDKLARLDMAHYSAQHEVSKLFGPPPGYVGYPDDDIDEEKRQRIDGTAKAKDPSVFFTEMNRIGGSGVLLFDEMEKAHPDVWDSMLTIFDEGYLKTSVGNVIDFTDTIIILTSNLGAREFDKARHGVGFAAAQSAAVEDPAGIKSIVMGALKRYLKPEIIGRITSVVPFRDLTSEEMHQVLSLELTKALRAAKSVAADISLSEALRNRIVDLCVQSGYGARQLSRLLDSYVVDTLVSVFFDDPALLATKGLQVTLGYRREDVDIVTLEGTTLEYRVETSALEAA